MYNTFYGLTADPFRLTPDSHACFEHPAFLQTARSLLYSATTYQGLMVLHGLPGTGKTMLLQHLATHYPSAASCSLLQASGLDISAFTQHFLSAGTHLLSRDKRQAFSELAHQFSQRSTVLLIDEAQALPDETFALLIALYQATRSTEHPLTIILSTHSANLKRWRNQHQLEHVHTKVTLPALDEQTTNQYINFRLSHYGFSGEVPFSPRSQHFIHRFSRGIPRRINLICSRLLLHGQLTQTRNLTLADLHQIVCELTDERLLPTLKKR